VAGPRGARARAHRRRGRVIEFRSVRKVFSSADGGESVAVDDLDLRIENGETHCLIGTSGCGKTTTLRLVNRLEEPTRGVVAVGGHDVRSLDVYELRRRIGYVIQSAGLFPHMDVERNVGVMCELAGQPAGDVRRRARELLARVNLDPDEFAGRYPAQLSGGQQQRVGIARALALDPEYLLMDEPFGALDPITRRELRSELRPLFAELDKTVLLVTHDLDEAFELGSRVTVMDRGVALQTGTRAELVDEPANEFVARFVRGHGAAR